MPASETFWRPLKKMHVVFAVSTFALAAVTFWMMADDYKSEWRKHQQIADQLNALKLTADLDGVESADGYQDELNRLNQQIEQAEKKVESQQQDISKQQAEVARFALTLKNAERDVRSKRAVRDKSRADYDLGVRDELPQSTLDEYFEVFTADQAVVDRLETEAETHRKKHSVAKANLDKISKGLDELNAEKNAMEARAVQLRDAINALEPDSILAATKRKMLDWPILDGFSQVHKIQMDWLPDLHIQLGMAKTARFDRCRTCHISIDRIEAGNVPTFPYGHVDSTDPKKWVAENKFPHPYATHPRPELYLTAASPHPVQTFGCTICHEGQGSATNFNNAQHGPNNPHQEEVWEEKYHHHYNHFWEYPMLSKRFQESSCLKCHHDVVELGVNPKFGASAPKLFRGYQLLQKYGCFGCHEIHGFTGGEAIGPDVRLEPNYNASALELLTKLPKAKNESKAVAEIRGLAGEVADAPVDTAESRNRLRDLVTADAKSPSPLLPAAVHKMADQFKDVEVPGRYRKVGPSLRYVATKTTPGWIEHWTEEPKRFRPTTRMPQFFGNTNQQDAHAAALMPVELTAIAEYLIDKSQPLDLPSPPPVEVNGEKQSYKPDAKRGKELFAKQGCLACHSHKDFPKITADFGPDLSKVHAKVRPGEAGFNWLYNWLRDPKRYHPRTKMPNLFLTQKQVGDTIVDPAADIAAYLLAGGPEEYQRYSPKPYLGLDVEAAADNAAAVRVVRVMPLSPASRATGKEGKPVVIRPGDIIRKYAGRPVKSAAELNGLVAKTPVGRRIRIELFRSGQAAQLDVVIGNPLDDMVRLFLTKAVGIQPTEEFLRTRKYPGDPAKIKGDEIELVAHGDGKLSNADWQRMKLNYVGRRTISRYGCYGCHDIPAFEEARPIGTTLQDWGRKDTSKLALEHIEEYLHHHGEPDGSSTKDRVEQAIKDAKAGGLAAGEFDSAADEEREMSTASLYEKLMHHRREGFLWQKLRQPRSYDYRKVETKGYDERLRMPKFPFNESEIEAISTFVLGLVAEPPAEQYVYHPAGAAKARIDGEFLLEKYNCAGCHMLELPQIAFALDMSDAAHPFRDEIGWTADEVAEWFVDTDRSHEIDKLTKDVVNWFAAHVDDLGKLKDALDELETKLDVDLKTIGDSDLSADKLEAAEKTRLAKYQAEVEKLLAEIEPVKGNEEQEARQIGRLKEVMQSMGIRQGLKQLIAWASDGEEPIKTLRAKVRSWVAAHLGLILTDDVRFLDHLGAPLAEIFALTEDPKSSTDDKSKRAELVKGVRTWLDEHPQYMLADELKPPAGEFPQGVAHLLKLKPPRDGDTGLRRESGEPIIRFHGLLNKHLPEEEPEDEEFSFDLWDTLNVGGRIKLPSSNMFFTGAQIERDSMVPARGGVYAQWLVEYLFSNRSSKAGGDRGMGWTMSPPPLALEGLKVQTPWLYKFLKNPHVIRHETVLRMPRFNLDDEEAKSLANYFAAVDDSEFPYQQIPQREPSYADHMNSQLAGDIAEGSNYLYDSWKLLNANLCMGCHTVGGKTYVAGPDPKKALQGPDLNRVHERLRPDWLTVWLSRPQWITPYTKMAIPKAEPSLLGGKPSVASDAWRDALLNYPMLLERDGAIFYDPKDGQVKKAAEAVAAPLE